MAARFLAAHAPRGWDIEQVADGFEPFFAGSLAEGAPEAREAWLESARIDAACRAVFSAPLLAPFRPSASDAAHLLEGQLVVSPALRVVEEHRALLALRTTLLDASSAVVELPPRLANAQAWAIVRSGERTAHIALESREAELIQLLAQCSIGNALACLERACPADEKALLPERARAWLARSVALGFWCGFRAKDGGV